MLFLVLSCVPLVTFGYDISCSIHLGGKWSKAFIVAKIEGGCDRFCSPDLAEDFHSMKEESPFVC